MNLLSQETIQALGWTILHSLWQAALIAILLVISLIILRKNSSKMRYFVTSLAMLTVLMVSIITFISINRFQSHQSSASDSPMIAIPEGQVMEITVEKTSSGIPFYQTLNHFGIYFEQHLPLIVSIWFIGVVLLALRFLGAFAYLQRLKHHKTQEASEYWKGTLKYLSSQVGVKQSVQLFESALVQVPMVIGHFKPVILLPLGALTGLSQHQIESILAHELAHIKRHDYLINILQSLLEIVLFFNPFVWWISSKIREERENCCDDIAVAVTGDHLTFVKTLATLEELKWQSMPYAVAFAGQSKGGLFNRVNRLLQRKNRASSFSEGFTSALVLILCLAVVSLQARTPYTWIEEKISGTIQEMVDHGSTNTEPKEAVNQVEPPLAPAAPLEPLEGQKLTRPLVENDTIRFGDGFMIITDKRGRLKVFKDGQEIPESEFEKYTKDFKVGENKVTISPDSGNEVAIKIDPMTRRSLNGKVVFIDSDDDFEIEIPEVPELPEIPVIPEMPNIRIDLDDEDFSFNFNSDHDNKVNIVIDGDNLIINGKDWEKNWETFGKKWEKYGEEWGEWGEKFAEKFADIEFEDLNIKIHDLAGKIRRDITESKEYKKFKAELVKDGYADENDNSLSITYNKGGLKINGNKIPEAQEKKYKELLEDMGVNLRRGSSFSWSFTED